MANALLRSILPVGEPKTFVVANVHQLTATQVALSIFNGEVKQDDLAAVANHDMVEQLLQVRAGKKVEVTLLVTHDLAAPEVTAVNVLA